MISTGTGFKVLSRDSIDERFILSKDQMLNIDEAVQPENYFCVCTDDSMLYVYNVNNPEDPETGKFRKVGSNESVDPSIFQKINDDTLTTDDKTVVGAINELDSNKIDKPAVDGTAGQILVLQDDGSLAYADNVSEFDDTALQEAMANKLDKPVADGTPGQILVLQDDNTLAYQDNVTEFDDTALQEAIANKIDKPAVDGTVGQILVVQDDGSLAYADNVTEYDDTALQEALETKISKPETDGAPGQILVLQDDNTLAYQDNVTEYNDTELRELIDTKVDKVEGSSLVADTEIAKIHEHANQQDVLDNLTKDADSGKLLFEGNPISVDVNIATVDAAGTVKPDGTTITITDDGTITAVGSGGSAVLTEEITTNIEVGGIKSGTLLGTGLTFNDYVRMVHVTYLAPGVTLTITPSTTLYKVGTNVTGLVAKVTVTKKSEDITKIEFLVNDVVKETITTDVANGGTFSYTVDDFSTDTTIKAIVYDTSSNVPKTSTVKFVSPYYCGTTNDVPTADTIVALTELVETKGSKTRTITCANKHVVIAYPASYGKLTSILDGNGFENLTDYTNIQETINSVSYEVYYTTGKKTLTNFKYTYK